MRSEIIEALSDPDVTAEGLSQALKERGVRSISPTTLRRYRLLKLKKG